MRKASRLLAILLAMFLFYVFLEDKPASREHLAFYPADTSVAFTDYYTSLQLYDKVDGDEYKIKWTAFSNSNRSVDMRHDISLLYEDGRLIGKMSKTQENEDDLRLMKKVKSEDSGHFQSISVHYARIRYPNEAIRGRQMMSYDQLYVTASSLGQVDAFEIPKTEEEKEWKNILDHAAKQQLHYIWGKLLNGYDLQPNQYYRFPLTYLHVYARNPLPGLNQKQTEQAIGKLWERIYKQYFLGMNTSTGHSVSPEGSIMPVVLLDKAGARFIVLTETAQGEHVKIVQPLN